MSFHIGQKIEYVGGSLSLSERLQRWIHPYRNPDKGVIYTVVNVYYCVDDEQVIELLEFPSPADGYWDAGFYANAFRPVVERNTDISVFKRMLAPVKVKADAKI